MESRHKVLWIEDSALGDLAYLTAPLYMDGGYELVVAETVSEALSFLELGEFDAVIVDIRLFPGHRSEWRKPSLLWVPTRLRRSWACSFYAILEPRARRSCDSPRGNAEQDPGVAWQQQDRGSDRRDVGGTGKRL